MPVTLVSRVINTFYGVILRQRGVTIAAPLALRSGDESRLTALVRSQTVSAATALRCGPHQVDGGRDSFNGASTSPQYAASTVTTGAPCSSDGRNGAGGAYMHSTPPQTSRGAVRRKFARGAAPPAPDFADTSAGRRGRPGAAGG